MLLDDAIHRGESEPGAFAHRFRGEEGLKEMALGFGAHAAAVVFDAEDHVTALPGVGMAAHRGVKQVHLLHRHPDGCRPAAGHRGR